MDEREIDLIIKSAIESNSVMFKELCTCADSTVRFHVKMLLRGENEAYDAIYETYKFALQHMDSIVNFTDIEQWLAAITYRVCYNKLAAKKQEDKPIWNRSPNDLKNSSPFCEAIASVSNAINELPGLQRMVVLMYYYDGFSEKQISEIIMCGESEVKEILRNIINKLSACLDNKDYEKTLSDIITLALSNMENECLAISDESQKLWRCVKDMHIA